MAYMLPRMVLCVLIALLFLHELCFAELPPNYSFVHEATTAANISHYDYIVIGGGTAGIPLASTLSANYSVLLLERGGSPYGNTNISSVFNIGSYFLDMSPTSVAQQFISEGVVNSRPRVLGGATCINAGFYSRGERAYFREARLSDEGLVNRSYEWAERVIAFKPIMQKFQSALKNALLEVGVTPDNNFTYDHIIGTKLAGSIFDENGTRHTAADLLQYANPKGLLVLLHATVERILFRTKGRSRPLAYGVVFRDSAGHKHTTYLKRGGNNEIILSAGALGSPQVLMLSGIGPREQLDAHNIRVVLHHPNVGKGMADNPVSSMFVPSPISVEEYTIQVVGITQFGSYIEGIGGFNFALGNSSVYQGFYPQMGSWVYEKINGPISTGELRLVNRNPADNPSVTFNYFKEPQDLQKCVNGLRTILKALDSKAFSSYRRANMTTTDILALNKRIPVNLRVQSTTNLSLAQYCKDSARTLWHYHGGCHMGKVVNHEYKVFGVDALRVIDGSTIIHSPGTNPQASVLMLGRYMGVTILNQRLANETNNNNNK